jgi:FAD/FMN-containing dehydrogenase
LQKYGVWDHLPIKPVFDGYPIKRLIIASQTWVRVNDHDPYWIKQFQDAQAEMRNWFVHKGGLYQQRMPPLLMPEYVWDVQMGAFNLTRSIKEKLDPHNILSPGLYDFMESAR